MYLYAYKYIAMSNSNPIIKYYSNGNKYSETWYKNDKIHREDDPAMISYHNNGQKADERWIINNKYHKLDGPAVIFYYSDGEKYYEQWFQNGKIHKTDGPAIITYYGIIQQEFWYQNNKPHRLDGPAHIEYNLQGNITNKKYYIFGIILTQKEYEKVINIFRRKIRTYQRQKLLRVLKKNRLDNKISSDMCSVLAQYVY